MNLNPSLITTLFKTPSTKFNSISMASSSTSKTLTLVSSDGHEFQVEEGAAVLSITLKNMVEDDCADNPIPVREVDGKTLSKVIVYLKKHGGGDELSGEDERAFNIDFLASEALKKHGGGDELSDEDKIFELRDLLLAANYLEIKGLLDIVALKIGDISKDKPVDWVRKVYGIENDYSPEEEEMLRNEHPWAHEDLHKDN